MTPTEQDKELREAILLEFKNVHRLAPADYTENCTNIVMQLITADRRRVALEARIDPFEFVEPCEPDCDDVRHAYHQGQWDMATRIKAQQEEVWAEIRRERLEAEL